MFTRLAVFLVVLHFPDSLFSTVVLHLLFSSSVSSGMSMVPEVTVAKHCGLQVVALSLITNKVFC